VCPHCGTAPDAPPRDDETMSGLIVEPRRTWMLQLLGEVLERALSTHKLTEAERILQRAADEFAERVASGESVEGRQLMQIADYAIRLALMQNDARWIEWVTRTFKTVEYVPTAAVIDRLSEARRLPGVTEMVADVLTHWRANEGELTHEEVASLGRLDAMVRPAGT
jgi:hypothetical protein